MAELNQISASFSLSKTSPSSTRHFSLSVDLTLPYQGITAIFGHSGSGKTTLLRLMAGLDSTVDGVLIINGETWQHGKHFIPTYERSIGYVFQEASLFPHLNVQKNLNYAIKRSEKPVDENYITQITELLGIEDLLAYFPSQLSGGEQQRVAIARALLVQPKLLLMDEPLSSLDETRKQEILPYLETVRDELKLPIIYVSHSMSEVTRLADHVVVLENGHVKASGSAKSVFSRLDLPFEQDAGVILSGKITDIDTRWQLAQFSFSGGSLWIKNEDVQLGQNIRVQIHTKDISLTLSNNDDTSVLNRLHGKVIEIKQNETDAMALVKLQIGEEFFIASVTKKSVDNLSLVTNKSVWVLIKSVAIVR